MGLRREYDTLVHRYMPIDLYENTYSLLYKGENRFLVCARTRWKLRKGWASSSHLATQKTLTISNWIFGISYAQNPKNIARNGCLKFSYEVTTQLVPYPRMQKMPRSMKMWKGPKMVERGGNFRAKVRGKQVVGHKVLKLMVDFVESRREKCGNLSGGRSNISRPQRF